MKIGPRQRELLQAFSAFPEEDQEKMLQEIKDKKKSMEETIARWLAAQKAAGRDHSTRRGVMPWVQPFLR